MEIELLTPQEFEQCRALILTYCGIHVPENKVMLLSNRIRRRLRATSCDSFQAYLKLLKSPAGAQEREGFLNAITTNETSFFRTARHFEWLGGGFVDDLRNRARTGQHPQQVRIWSAACSSGEEPYSIAMCMAENRFRLPGWSVRVFGTDISEDALDKARAGVYGGRMESDVSEKLRTRYFSRVAESGQWQVKPALRELVTFSHHNLMQPVTESGFDCIFIRNVLIYFSRESKQVVIRHLVNALADGGWLVVGPSEGIYDMLGMLQKHSTFLYRKA